MKNILLPIILAFAFQSQIVLSQEVFEQASDCSLFVEIVTQVDQQVESLTSQFKLARINGSGNLTDLEAQLNKAKAKQVYFREVLAQCLQD